MWTVPGPHTRIPPMCRLFLRDLLSVCSPTYSNEPRKPAPMKTVELQGVPSHNPKKWLRWWIVSLAFLLPLPPPSLSPLPTDRESDRLHKGQPVLPPTDGEAGCLRLCALSQAFGHRASGVGWGGTTSTWKDSCSTADVPWCRGLQNTPGHFLFAFLHSFTTMQRTWT